MKDKDIYDTWRTCRKIKMNEIKEKALKMLDEYIEQMMELKTIYSKVLDPTWEPHHDSEVDAYKNPDEIEDSNERDEIKTANIMVSNVSNSIESVGSFVLELFDNDTTIRDIFKKHNAYVL